MRIVCLFAYGSGAPSVDRDELLRMRDRMITRGPDGCGAWYSADKRVGLGHRRPAVIDPSAAGAQPMADTDGNSVITFNGEIYNYRELRDRLEKKGRRFRSRSDTEVLLQLDADKGAEMVHDLRGMYAFAIRDEREGAGPCPRSFRHQAPLLRGQRPDLSLRFSSKGASGRRTYNTVPEPAGHAGFFLWGHVPEPYTLYRGIKSLPAGTSLWIDNEGKKRFSNFCSISRELAEAGKHPLSPGSREMRERIRTTLLDSVRHHLIADVPVGVFLSSGLDSTTLAALTAEVATGELHTVTLGFKEYRGTGNDEVPLAEQVARHYGAYTGPSG